MKAVAAAAARSGVIHARASESGPLKRSFSSPRVASAQITSRHFGDAGTHGTSPTPAA